jgi:hypothetical protein
MQYMPPPSRNDYHCDNQKTIKCRKRALSVSIMVDSPHIVATRFAMPLTR